MSRRPQKDSVTDLIEHVNARLRDLSEDIEGLELRDKVLRLVRLQRKLSDLGIRIAQEGGINAQSARERIRLYFLMYSGTVIKSDELRVVSGISDYPRRIRELRIERGYQIISGGSADSAAGVELRPDEYILVSETPDADSARRWHVANRIRRSDAGSRERVLQFLRENVGGVVTTEELAYVARSAKEFARRVRELRTEQGYPIATMFTGRPDLHMGQYVLESLERVSEPHDRNVPLKVQREVFSRDRNTCVCRGWTRERWGKRDPRILELHHLDEHAGGGPNTMENLAVVCSRCHDDVHAGRLTMRRTEGAIRCERCVGKHGGGE